MTPETIKYLASQGYTVLIAENQSKEHDYIFLPLKANIDDFIDRANDFDNHVVLFIVEVLEMPSELFLCHEVIL